VMLLSEDQGRAVVTCRVDDAAAILELSENAGVVASAIGSTGGSRLVVRGVLDLSLKQVQSAWEVDA